jgi:serine/threonine protein kinase
MPSLPDELIGHVVAGRYRVLERLGQGGMGTVYLAEHEAIEKKVALKVLRPEYSAKPDLVTRFQREAISASRIKHPNVLDVFDFGQIENGCFYLAMEFLEGRDLADDLEESGVIPPGRALRLTLQVCKALAAAHAKGVVHRDMKPENVFLQLTAEGEEQVKIVDFGIAQLRTNEEIAEAEPQRRRLTRTGMIFGTPEYMSPEQAAGRRMDLRVDVYATGVILFEMLTGSVPFTGDTFFGVLNAHMNEPVPSLRSLNPDVQVSTGLEAVVTRALAKNPDERFSSMRDLADALLATPEGAALDPFARKSVIPGVTLAEFDRAASARAEEALPLTKPKREAATSRAAIAQTVPATGEVARADTLVAGERSAPAPRPASRGVLWGVTLLAALGATAFVGIRLTRSGNATPASTTEVAPPPTPTPSLAPLPEPVVAPLPSAEPPSSVKLRVKTEPAGAVLTKNGFQVCDSTPCEIDVAPKESITLEAKKGALKGSAKVQPQRDQGVEITLSAPATQHSRPPQQVWCFREVQKGEMKSLEKFRCPQ